MSQDIAFWIDALQGVYSLALIGFLLLLPMLLLVGLVWVGCHLTEDAWYMIITGRTRKSVSKNKPIVYWRNKINP